MIKLNRRKIALLTRRYKQRAKRRIKAIGPLLSRYRMETAVVVGTVLFLLLLVLSYRQGAGGFGVGDFGPETNDQEEKSEAPRALEASFERWYRSEEGELLASFFLFNHSERTVREIQVVCATFRTDGSEIRSYRRNISVDLMPGQVRHLSKTRIGELDPTAQRAICRIDSWN